MTPLHNDHFMSPEELRAWNARPEAPAVDPKPTAARKTTQAGLNLALLNACASGELTAARRALADGADPNIRLKTKAGTSALGLALQSGNPQLALEVFLAGGFIAPNRYEDSSKDFEAHAKANNPFTCKLQAEALRELCRLLPDWASLRQARAHSSLVNEHFPDHALFDEAFIHRNFSACVEASKNAAIPAPKTWTWTQLFTQLSMRNAPFENPPWLSSSSFIELVRAPGLLEHIGSDNAKTLFRSAIEADSLELIRALLDAGIRPGSDWSLSKRQNWREQYDKKSPKSMGLIWASAAFGSNRAFEFLLGCPPALDHARSREEPLESMALCPIGRLLTLHAAGIRIEHADVQGNTLAHHWAMLDEKPRDGWASLAKRFPELTDAPNRQGKTARALMADRLHGKAKDDFLASFARFEARAIQAAAGGVKKPNKTPAKNRL